MSTGGSTNVVYGSSAGTGTVSCNGVGTTTTAGMPLYILYSLTPDHTVYAQIAPTAATTKSPTKVPTNVPTPSPTDNPIPALTGDPSPSPTPAPTNYPTRSPTDAPFTPGSPTSSPSESTLSPTRLPTDNPTKRPTYDPVKAPTFQPTKVGDTPHPTRAPVQSGADCITVSGSDNFDGDWTAVGSSAGQIAYRDDEWYLYYAASSADNYEKFWTFSNALGTDSFNNGWCSQENILDCSGNWEDAEVGAQFSECGQSVTLAPTQSPSANDVDDGGNGNVDGEEAETILPGVDNNVLFFVISIVALCGCCVLLACAFICWRNSRLGTFTFDEKVSGHGNDW